MKTIVTPILLILFIFYCFLSYSQCSRLPYPYKITMPSCNNGVYTLKFEDNFNGSQLDANVWTLPLFGLGSMVGDGSHQLYTLDSDNLEVSNGTLKIKAQDQPKTGRVIGYCPPQCEPCATQQDIDNCILSDGLPNLRTHNRSSSNIWTIRNDFLEGKYEIRCRIDKGKGLWPAFWTFSGDSESGGTIWSEHDFFEIYYDQELPFNQDPFGNYRNNFAYTNNIHFDLNNDGSTANEQCSYKEVGSDFENWHIFTCYFEEDKIEYFIDGQFINRKTRYRTTSGQSLFCDGGIIEAGSAWDINGWPRQPMQLVLNMAIETGGNAPNNPSIFPATFEVDYVRYWEKEPGPIPCNNDVIEIGLFSGFKKGDNALLFLNATVASFANVTAGNEIHILPNFHAPAGSVFRASINPFVCGSTARIGDTTEYDEEIQNNLANEEYSLIKNNSQIEIYPNPTTGIFNVNIIDGVGVVEIKLMDLFGKVIFRETSNKSNFVFDLSDYPKGMYLLKTTVNSKLSVQKVIYQ